jgi:hypothetical protein
MGTGMDRTVPKVQRGLLLGLALVSLAAAFGPSLWEHVRLSEVTFSDDVRLYIAPYLRSLGDGPRDYVERYLRACQPIGFRALLTAGSRIMDATTINRFLPYALLAVMGVVVWRGVRPFGGLAASWGAVAMMLSCSAFLFRIGCGLPRSFGLPIFGLGLLAAVEGRVYLLGASVALGALFYPPVVAPLALTLGLVLFALPARGRGGAASWSFRRRLAVLGVAGALALGITRVADQALKPYGRLIGPDDFAAYPEADRGGRHRNFLDRMDYNRDLKYCILHFGGQVYRTYGKPWLAPAREWARQKAHRRTLRRLLWLVLIVGGGTAVATGAPARRLLLATGAALGSYLVAREFSPLLFLLGTAGAVHAAGAEPVLVHGIGGGASKSGGLPFREVEVPRGHGAGPGGLRAGPVRRGDRRNGRAHQSTRGSQVDR